MFLFYIHHGSREVKGGMNQSNDLTKLGVADVKITAKIFDKLKSKYNIKAIFTSPYLRCKKTAQIINKKLNVPVYEDDRLNEFRSVENEIWVDCQKRIMELLKEIVVKFGPNDTILCVTSGVNLAAFTNAAYNLKPNEKAIFPIVPMCSPIGFELSKENFE